MFRESLPFIYPSLPPACSLVFASCSFSGQVEASRGWGSLEYVEPYWRGEERAGAGGEDATSLTGFRDRCPTPWRTSCCTRSTNPLVETLCFLGKPPGGLYLLQLLRRQLLRSCPCLLWFPWLHALPSPWKARPLRR